MEQAKKLLNSWAVVGAIVVALAFGTGQAAAGIRSGLVCDPPEFHGTCVDVEFDTDCQAICDVVLPGTFGDCVPSHCCKCLL